MRQIRDIENLIEELNGQIRFCKEDLARYQQMLYGSSVQQLNGNLATSLPEKLKGYKWKATIKAMLKETSRYMHPEEIASQIFQIEDITNEEEKAKYLARINSTLRAMVSDKEAIERETGDNGIEYSTK